MTSDTASKIALAVLTLLAAVAQLSFRGNFGRRAEMKRDAELLGLLPPDTAPHDRLLERIDRSLERLAAEEDEQTVDRNGIILGFAHLLVAGLMATLGAQGAGWGWWVAAGALAVLSLASLTDAGTRAKRDQRGMRIFPPSLWRDEASSPRNQHFGYMVLTSSDGLISLKDDKVYSELGQTRELVSKYQAEEDEDGDRYSVAVIVPLGQ